jgi:hypothetical protein
MIQRFFRPLPRRSVPIIAGYGHSSGHVSNPRYTLGGQNQSWKLDAVACRPFNDLSAVELWASRQTALLLPTLELIPART